MMLSGHTALLGGSFNPPHLGHQMLCLCALEALGAEEVWMLPARVHPFHKALVDFDHRVQMCQRVTRIFGTRARVDDVERDEQLSGRTYDTLRVLQARHPERSFALLVGSDILSESHEWYRWDDIQSMVRVAVIGRDGHIEAASPNIVLPDISSKEIRRRLSAQQSVEGLLPVAVAEYINEHGLYR